MVTTLTRVLKVASASSPGDRKRNRVDSVMQNRSRALNCPELENQSQLGENFKKLVHQNGCKRGEGQAGGWKGRKK